MDPDSTFANGARWVEAVGLFLLKASGGILLGLIAIALLWDVIQNHYALLPLSEKVVLWIRKHSGKQSPEKLVEAALAALGYSPQSVAAMRSQISSGAHEFHSVTVDACYRRLLVLLTAYTVQSHSERIYGWATPVKSRYYINTMAASHNIGDRHEMIVLMEWLIARRAVRQIDFVLVPKSGNPLLADGVAQKRGYCCLFRKHQGDASRLRDELSAPPAPTKVNIEGLEQLIQLSNKSLRRLYGIVVDCNCSGGSTHKQAIVEFNEIARALTIDVDPIEHVYVLYRPDSSALTEVTPGRPLNVERFFDLTEELKERLWRLGQRPGKSADPAHSKEVEDIVAELRRNHLTKCDL